MNLHSDRRILALPLHWKGGSGTHFFQLFLAMSSALLFFLTLHHWADRSREYEALLDKENAKLVMAGNLISFHLNDVIARMAVLAKDPSIQETLRHPLPANRQALDLELSTYVEQQGMLEEILLLDLQGHELSHVSSSRVARLQPDGVRQLRGKVAALEKDQVYLAPFRPETSAGAASLHVAVPLFNPGGGAKTGILVAVYSGSHLRHLLDDVLGPTPGHVAILNANGDKIYSQMGVGGSAPPAKDPARLPLTNPALWKQILAAPAERIDEGGGWLLSTTVALAHNLFLHGSIGAVTDRSPNGLDNRPEWKILSFIPPSAVNPAWEKRLMENLPLYFLMFGGTGLFAWQRSQRKLEARQAEEALKASRGMLITVLDSMEASVYVTDMHSHEILFANQHLCRVLDQSDLVGKLCWRELYPSQDGPCPNCNSPDLLVSRGVMLREFQHADNGRWFQIRDHAIRWVDGRTVRMEIATDITEQKESMAIRCARKLALEQNSRFNIAEEMASGLAHELSQPLAAASNYLDASLRMTETPGYDPEKLRQGLRLAHRQTERAGKIVSHIKRTIRKRGSERAAIDINRLLQETVGYLEYEIRQYDVAVAFDLAPGPFPAVVNGVEIEQVLLNLMKNAIDSMRGTFLRRLTLSSRPTKESDILVQISDTGKGIPHADLDFIFNPFLTTKNDGLGLGLTICRTIIESYGGRIWAESSAGHGATFCFTLPGGSSHE